MTTIDEKVEKLQEDVGVIKQKLFNGYGETMQSIKASQEASAERLEHVIEKLVRMEERQTTLFRLQQSDREDIDKLVSVVEGHGSFLNKLKGFAWIVVFVSLIGGSVAVYKDVTGQPTTVVLQQEDK